VSSTPVNGLRFPTGSNAVSVEADLHNLASDVDSKLLGRFATTAARDTAWAAWSSTNGGAAIPNGVSAWCDTPGAYFKRIGGVWRQQFEAPVLLWSLDNGPSSGAVAVGLSNIGAVNALGPAPTHTPGALRVQVGGQLIIDTGTTTAGYLQLAFGATQGGPNLGNLGVRQRFHNSGAASVLSYYLDTTTASDGTAKWLYLMAWNDALSSGTFTVFTNTWQVWQVA
jgi:hypothetical protein